MASKPEMYRVLNGERWLKDLYHREDMSVDRCQTILLLVTDRICGAEVEEWTEKQRKHAANWAIREHLSASDNRTLRIQVPHFLRQKVRP